MCENPPSMPQAVVLTPEARPRPPVPRWAIVTLLGGPFLIALLFRLTPAAGIVVGGTRIARPWLIAATPLVLAAIVLAIWLERRAYLALWPMRPARRLSGTYLLPIGGVLLTLSVLAPLLQGRALLPELAVLLPAVVIGGYWFVGASLGSALTVSVDVVVSALVRRFRSRVLLAILALLAFASIGSACIATWTSWMVGRVASGKTQLEQVTPPDPQQLALEALQNKPLGPPARPRRVKLADRRTAEQLLHFARLHPFKFDALLFVLTLLAFFPVALSAVDKLAEGVMERLHPIAHGFDLLAQGRRDVRIEEAGSIEFIQLGIRFNRMANSLTLAERMERAFGMYVSGQLMRRIREQHGEALLPAALREATVLFADIRGFTSISEQLSPEAIVALLNRYFDRVVAVVNAHDGFLNKFIGDAVVVVFNGPVDQPDHPERAVRCAIALQQAVEAANAEGAFPEVPHGLRVGIGVATGPMVCGNIGGQGQVEYTVIGDTVNLASRLTGKAGPGEVWTNSLAATQLPQSLPAEPLTPITVKGKAEPVLPFRVWPAPRRTTRNTLAATSG